MMSITQPQMDVKHGIMGSVHNAHKDGISTHKDNVNKLVIFVEHGKIMDNVLPVIMDMYLVKVHVLEITKIQFNQLILIDFVQSGVEKYVFLVLKDLSLI